MKKNRFYIIGFLSNEYDWQAYGTWSDLSGIERYVKQMFDTGKYIEVCLIGISNEALSQNEVEEIALDFIAEREDDARWGLPHMDVITVPEDFDEKGIMLVEQNYFRARR